MLHIFRCLALPSQPVPSGRSGFLPQISKRRTAGSYRKFSLITASLVLIAFIAPFANAQSVLIDDWTESSTVNAEGTSDTAGRSAEAPSSILGDFRNIYAEAQGSGQISYVGVGGFRSAEFANSTSSTGIIRIIWDGQALYPINPSDAQDGVNDPVDYSDLSQGLTDSTYFNPIGLRDADGDVNKGVDLEGTGCLSGDNAQGISLLFGSTDQGTVTIIVDVFTDDQNWSRATVQQDFENDQVFTFFFNGDTSQDNVFSAQGGTGADFSDVGAIVLTLEALTEATDLDFASPVLADCGTDLGDAPGEAIGDNEVSYRVLAREVGANSLDVNPNTGEFTIGSSNFEDPEERDLRGPHHTIGGPFLGLTTNDTDGEEDGQPSSSAMDDDADGNDDEQAATLSDLGIDDVGDQEFQSCDGIVMDPDTTPSLDRENWYCTEIKVSNPTDSWAQAVGWVDFRGSGSFDNLCGTDSGAGSGSSGLVEYGDFSNPENHFCERSSSTLIVGSTGLSNADGQTCSVTVSSGDTLDQNGDFTGGNVPPGCEGTLVMTWDLTNVLNDTTLNQTFARFRISTDRFENSDGTGFFTEAGPSPFAYASDGEVEDHSLEAGTLPVSISGFETIESRSGLEVRWSTVSETENVGFYLWNYSGGELELLTPKMIPSKATDAANPQDYSYTIPRSQGSDIGRLAITAVDNRGKEEMYGLFDIDASYGRDDASTPIDWQGIRAAAESRLATLGFQRMGETWRANSQAPIR